MPDMIVKQELLIKKRQIDPRWLLQLMTEITGKNYWRFSALEVMKPQYSKELNLHNLILYKGLAFQLDSL